ncbi:hypothetical protein [Nocardioides marmotae]|uniref:hypothetical protein n=1 Tax=Nocardioides marmotae TaxID=2663857 RepID=UPI0012B59FAB|nr:hypothetical protein [Nocardioides marmotae]MBC9734359.1 hypothetical protein [Nocardioides marmotae]MTB85458.1 hypothetical protein [Nocardioides marmotae]
MSELVVFYDEKPTETKGRVEIRQEPIQSATEVRSTDGAVRTSLVYVRWPSEAGPFLVPFAQYDDWSLRDRYNEAIRIMNTLGAASITCETFREVASRRGLRARVRGKGADLSQERVENSGFDFRHSGAGSAPRDPRPLRWPDEPGFAAAVSSVLDNGATDVVINIRSNRTYSVDGALGLSLKKAGFDLGASSQQSSATSLHIRASFPGRRSWR